MTDGTTQVVGGVDTHHDGHVAAVVNVFGVLLGQARFGATEAGYRQLLEWLAGHGPVLRVGVEGSGAYGAGLARFLAAAGVAVVEVDRPNRRTRRRRGKSDFVDAEAAARAALSGEASGTPKARTGPVEAIRVLQVARRGALKARTAAINQLHNLVLTAPEPLRAELEHLPTARLIERCRALRPGPELSCPTQATKTSLRRIARRVRDLTVEITDADADLDVLVAAVAPRSVAKFGANTHSVARLLVAIGDNPDRMRSEAAFAHLCGAAPIPASSGRTDRHRLNRAGDRQANAGLHTIALTRLAHDPRTRAYAERRAAENLKPKDILRCLKRLIAREMYHALCADLAEWTHPATRSRHAA